MATAPELARAHYLQRQRLAVSAAAGAQRIWDAFDRRDLAGSWAAAQPDLLRLVTVAQSAAAAGADPYVAGALAAAGSETEAEAAVAARAFAGRASDGRPLSGLLFQPVVTARVRLGAGASLQEAVRSGGFALARIVATQVQDAGRVADGVAVTARPAVGYVRMLSTPSCARCAVLAGRRYRWSDGFDRHPHCDCVHVPVAESAGVRDLTTDPRRYFDSLSEDEQARIFTVAGARAIRQGSDIGRVVNARRGMAAAGAPTTRELARRRGQRRLTPEGIYRQAGDDRDRAVELLVEHGYLVA